MIRALIELLYPSRAMCVGCGSIVGQQEPWICEKCLEALQKLRLTSGFQPRHVNILSSCHAYRYHEPVTGLVHLLKYRGVT